MDTSDSPALSRRALLAGVAGVPAGLALGRPAAGATQEATPTVATWNLSLGVDLSRLFLARSAEDLRRIAGDLLAEARDHPYRPRLNAVARQLDAVDADVVCLQEAALLGTRDRAGTDDADVDVERDLLADLRSALSAREAGYEVAASTVTTDAALPAAVEGGTVDFGLTDRVVLLVREGVEAADPRGDTFDAALRFPTPGGGDLTLRRGYCLADVTVDGATFAAVSTHLESVSSGPRRRQAAELLGALPEGGPVVVGGDLNSGPGTETEAYDRLTDGLTDAHAALRDGGGYTCCRDADLVNDRSRLDRRVDAVLARGADPVAVSRLGADREDRARVRRDGKRARVWPSDHAGVAATFELPAGTAAASPTATPGSSGSPPATTDGTATQTPATGAEDSPAGARTATGSGPGLGVPGALSALSALTLGALARRRRD